MQRVAVLGSSGSGKTTLAREIADRIDAEHVELDALFHRADWTPTPTPALRRDVAAALDTDRWVVCGNYSTVADLVHGGADTIVWLDLPKSVVMRRVVKRTLRRAVRREELWNGNREPLTNFYRWGPEENIVRWAWTMHDHYRQRYLTAIEDGTWDHATVHRLSSVEAVSKFLDEAT